MNANGEHRHHPHCTASSPWMAFSSALESGLPPAAVFPGIEEQHGSAASEACAQLQYPQIPALTRVRALHDFF